MLVERTREDGKEELLLPTRTIFVVAGVLFFLSFLSYDIIDFPRTSDEKPTAWHLLRWHIFLWMGLSSMLWAGVKHFQGKEGLLSGKAGRALTKLVARFPSLAEKRFTFDPSTRSVTLTTKTSSVEVKATEGGVVHIESTGLLKDLGTNHPDSDSLGAHHVEYRPEKGSPVFLLETRHYPTARRLAERVTKVLGVPLVDKETGEERTHEDLDKPLWEIPTAKPKSLPWPKNKKEWGFRRTPDGFRGTLGITVSNIIGTIVCAALITGYFLFLVTIETKIESFVYLLGGIFGTIAFLWTLSCLPYLVGARIELEISPTRIRYGMCWLKRYWFLDQSMPTETLEAIYSKVTVPCLVSDQTSILLGGNDSLTKEESDRFGKLLHWMIVTTVGKAKEEEKKENS